MSMESQQREQGEFFDVLMDVYFGRVMGFERDGDRDALRRLTVESEDGDRYRLVARVGPNGPTIDVEPVGDGR